MFVGISAHPFAWSEEDAFSSQGDTLLWDLAFIRHVKTQEIMQILTGFNFLFMRHFHFKADLPRCSGQPSSDSKPVWATLSAPCLSTLQGTKG